MKLRPAFLGGALVCLAILSAAFVAHRNASYLADATGRADDLAARLAAGAPLSTSPEIIAYGVVSPPRASKRYPFLHRRQLVFPSARALGGPDAPLADKRLVDAATEAETRGAFTALDPHDASTVTAALPTSAGTAVVILAPATGPAPYPWALVIGLFAAGLLATSVLGRGRPLVLTAALGAFALPCLAWHQPAPAIVMAAIALTLGALDARGLLARIADTTKRHRVPFTFLLPAAAGMLVLVLVPFAVGCVMGFFDHNQGQWTFVGLANFWRILSGDGRALGDPLNFWFTFGVTIAWTSLNVALHVVIGVGLALVLARPWLRARALWRVLLILPWAIPNYITALIWQGMFQKQYGAVNAILTSLGLAEVAWFSQFYTAFFANLATNVWLGFPFLMVAALSALQSIPRDLHEAASVDGAGPWSRFVHITLPNLAPALLPAVILGSIWTFNMFNVIYLVSGGRPAGATDILVTEAYRWAFERGQRYGLASAYAILIFCILAAWTFFMGRGKRRAS